MRIVKRLLAGLVGIVALLLVLVYGVSSWKMSRTMSVSDSVPVFTHDSATIARGAYLVRAITKCGECHGADLGGKLFIDGGPLGTFHAPNLTSGQGGLGKVLSDTAIVVAIRHGLNPTGHKLQWMPSLDWVQLADEDAAAIVAYLRSVPPIDRPSEPSSVGPLGRALYLAGVLPLFDAEAIEHDGIQRSRPPNGVTVEYGRYLANIGGCTGCHGPTLSGGPLPGAPPEFKPAANLTPEGIGHYTESDFFRALREGRRPNGTPIDTLMPVTATRQMTDDDIRAVFAFLRTVPPKPFGNR
ncbi:MAG: c-type cytochrome [Gemmatimonadaceae bacterium]|nr:c-type cytochrome [Gemmatimonadaceae bacterium]